jgi:hypothetical protein
VVEDAVQIRWNLLQIQVVFLVAVGATRGIEMLALLLLWRERGLDVTSGGDHESTSYERQVRSHRRSQL